MLELREVANDKSVPERAKKAANLAEIVKKIDKIAGDRIKEIDDAKIRNHRTSLMERM